ncbi:MAG: PilZ domain-containing protein [Candidatus Susulua stagnicola]|nr:PilZ domain-containing protein [Candidatus Susulua stagnicola]
MDEKRGFMRFQVAFPLKFIQSKLSVTVKGIVKDISMNGLKVILDRTLQFLSGDSNDFHLTLAADNVLEFSGQIIWQKDYPDRREIGIRFICIPDDHKEDIYNYIFKYHRQELTQKWWQM